MGSKSDNNHCNILLSVYNYDDDDDNNLDEMDGDIPKTSKKKKKKVSRKVSSLQKFLNMSNDGVLEATSSDHYYGEGEHDFIRWEILKEGGDVVEDVIQIWMLINALPLIFYVQHLSLVTITLKYSSITSFHHLRGKLPFLTNTFLMKGALLIPM